MKTFGNMLERAEMGNVEITGKSLWTGLESIYISETRQNGIGPMGVCSVQ